MLSNFKLIKNIAVYFIIFCQSQVLCLETQHHEVQRLNITKTKHRKDLILQSIGLGNITPQNKKETIIPKLENVIDLYYKLETAEDKNILLKSIIAKVTYLKTEKAMKKDSDPTNFELHIYPKIPRI